MAWSVSRDGRIRMDLPKGFARIGRHTDADLAMALQLARLIEADAERTYYSGGGSWGAYGESVVLSSWLRRCVEQELGR